jgi:hypothetical protein
VQARSRVVRIGAWQNTRDELQLRDNGDGDDISKGHTTAARRRRWSTKRITQNSRTIGD